MEELILILLRGAGYILYFLVIEGLFYQVFYYIGAIPVWCLSLGRYPSSPPHKLSKPNRIIYGIIGFVFSLSLGWYYLSHIS